jgi:uncharacterized C2H2 Zn-finger protein
VDEDEIVRMKKVHEDEKLRIATRAVLSVKNEARENKISGMMKNVILDQDWKLCPNPECKKRYEKNKIKCPNCGVFFKKYLSEMKEINKQAESKTLKTEKYTSSDHYDHIKSKQPEGEHAMRVLDPLLANPGSKRNILALANHVYQLAGIHTSTNIIPDTCPVTGLKLESSRQWTYLSADAAIALQVVS